MKKTSSIKILSQGKELIPNCQFAKSFSQRLIGLCGVREMNLNQSLYFEGGCQQMHSFFMKVPIDVIFLDKNNKIISICPLKPWNITPIYMKAQKVIEVPYNFCEENNLSKGISLEISK